MLNTCHWRAVDAGRGVIWRGGTDDEKIRKLALQDRAPTGEEDIHLVESVQPGLHSRGYRPAPLDYAARSDHLRTRPGGGGLIPHAPAIEAAAPLR